MKPSAALELKRAAVREATGCFRTANPRIFGSVLHGTDAGGSDLGLLVDALPGATLFVLGDSVDLRMPADLPPKYREQVFAEARTV